VTTHRLLVAATLAVLAGTPTDAAGSEPEVARVQSWSDATIGKGADRHARLAAIVRARGDALGLAPAFASGLAVTATGKPARGGTGLEIVEVRGDFAGTPVLGPIGHALVDVRRGGRVRTWVARGPVGALTNPIPRISAADARLAVEASGLPGASGRGRTHLAALPGPVHTRLAWIVEPPLDRRALVRPVFAVDAETGRGGGG
jgi:hypothetical protein